MADPKVFTIRFYSDNPRHAKALEVLQRRKELLNKSYSEIIIELILNDCVRFQQEEIERLAGKISDDIKKWLQATPVKMEQKPVLEMTAPKDGGPLDTDVDWDYLFG